MSIIIICLFEQITICYKQLKHFVIHCAHHCNRRTNSALFLSLHFIFIADSTVFHRPINNYRSVPYSVRIPIAEFARLRTSLLTFFALRRVNVRGQGPHTVNTAAAAAAA